MAENSSGDISGVKFLTVAEVATVMRVSKMTVYRLVHSGELPAVRVGRSFRVPEDAVGRDPRCTQVEAGQGPGEIERRDRRDGDVGARDGEYMRHVIDLPLHVRQAQETGGQVDLQVESARGPTTLVYLREPVH